MAAGPGCGLPPSVLPDISPSRGEIDKGPAPNTLFRIDGRSEHTGEGTSGHSD